MEAAMALKSSPNSLRADKNKPSENYHQGYDNDA
jgi:hypothetical protein